MSGGDRNTSGTRPSGAEQPRRRIPVLVLLPLIVFGGLAVLFFVQLQSGKDVSQIPSALIDKPVPEFSLPALDGLAKDGSPVPGLATADLTGRVTVVNIWASWCAPCRAEHPLLMELARDERIVLAGINYKDKAENARRFLGSLGNPYSRVGVDEKGRAAIDWGVYGVPETFIVGAGGRIRYKFIGPLTPESYRDVFLPKLEEALAAAQ